MSVTYSLGLSGLIMGPGLLVRRILRLKQIDIETHQMEEMMKHDLEYRG